MIEQFKQQHDEYKAKLISIATKYHNCRSINDYAGVQAARDEHAEYELFHAPDLVGESLLYYKAKENERKECEARTRVECRKKTGRSKTGDTIKYTYATAKEAEDSAFLMCSEERLAENEAHRLYNKMRKLKDDRDNLLHSMASKLRENR